MLYKTCAQFAESCIEHVHSIRTALEHMGKERKNKSNKTRVGIAFENAVLELLDEFANVYFGENHSKGTS